MAIDPREADLGDKVLFDWEDHYGNFENSIQPDLDIAREQAAHEVRKRQAGVYIDRALADLRGLPPTPEVVAHEYTLYQPSVTEELAGNSVAGLWATIKYNQMLLNIRLKSLRAGTLVVHLDARASSGRHGTAHTIEAKVLEQDVEPMFGLKDEQSQTRRDVLVDEARALPYPENSYEDNYTVETLLLAAVERWHVLEGKKVDMLIGESVAITYAEQNPSEDLYLALKRAGIDLKEKLPAEYGPIAQEVEQREIFESELDRLADQFADRLECVDSEAIPVFIANEEYDTLIRALLDLAPASIASDRSAAENVYNLLTHSVGERLAQRAAAEAKRRTAVRDVARLAFMQVQQKIRSSS